MSLYTFPTPSPIRGISFSHANDRAPVALIEAAPGASADQLSTIRRALDAGAWNCVPVSLGGREMLQVAGFEKEQQLLNYLQRYAFVEGTSEFRAEAGDNPTRTTREWVQDYGLKAAGYLNIVGDASLLGAGLMNGRSKEIAAGTLYTAGATVLARYGNTKTEYHVKQVLEETADFMKKQAVNLPEDCGMFNVMKEKREGAMASMDKFFTRYPSEVMLGAYTLGAFTMLQSGMKQKDPWGIAYGASSTVLKAASLLIPEKAPGAPKAEAHGPLGKFVDWVQEKPLRVYGFGSMVNNVILGMSAIREYRTEPNKTGAIFKFITASTYMLGDALIAISNKDHVNADGKFDADEQRGIVALVAESVLRNPPEMHEALTNNVAGFLATHAEMQGDAAEIAASIKEQEVHMKNNPWACRADNPIVSLANSR